jgi:hypothetical protein
MEKNSDSYPIRSPVLCKGTSGIIASAPIPNPDGSVSYYIKENTRTQRFLGIFNEKHLKPMNAKECKQHGKH